MITYSDWIRLYRRFTGVSDEEARGIGTVLMNQGRKQVLKAIDSYITEDTFLADTISGQADYLLPARTNKIDDVTVTVGTIKYTPEQITSPHKWNQLTIVTTPESTVPSFYYVDKFRLSLFPMPSATGNVIRALVTQIEPDITKDDIVVGSLSAINGETTVTGAATSWSSDQIGWFLLMPDGLWYEVDSVESTTSLSLAKRYEGATVSGADYRLGQVSLIPEEGQMLPIYYAAMTHFVGLGKDDKIRSFRLLYLGDPVVGDGLTGLKQQYRSRSEGRLTPGSNALPYPQNPNLYPQSITGA
jgi:hypothetical protein